VMSRSRGCNGFSGSINDSYKCNHCDYKRDKSREVDFRKHVLISSSWSPWVRR